MTVVLDCSMTLSWLFEDERTPATQMILERVASEGAVAPALWLLEIGNALQMGVRRGRIDIVFRDTALAKLEKLEIGIDKEGDKFAWSETIRLATAHDLTVYDATYLELAARKRLPLATLDRALGNAARTCGLSLATE